LPAVPEPLGINSNALVTFRIYGWATKDAKLKCFPSTGYRIWRLESGSSERIPLKNLVTIYLWLEMTNQHDSKDNFYVFMVGEDS
jgi:hypothetical protein